MGGSFKMSKKKKIMIIILVMLLIAGIFQISNNMYVSTFTEQNKTELGITLNKMMKGYVTNNKFSGTILVAKDNTILFHEGYSYSKRYMGKRKNEADTKFLIGFISKTFTALAIMQLHQHHVINLDDKVTAFFPEYENWEEVTVHQLLNHTSGIPNYYGSVSSYFKYFMSDITPEDILSTYQDKSLLFEPGQEFDYSNTNYILLGKIIEHVSNEDYITYLTTHIFEPLELENTGYEARPSSVKGLARGYALNNIIEVNYFNLSNLYSAGGLYSTVKDLYTFCSALDHDMLFNDKSKVKTSSAYYGYGLSSSYMKDGSQVFYHTGGGPGITTGMYHIPDKQIKIIILGNNQQKITEDIRDDIYECLIRN